MQPAQHEQTVASIAYYWSFGELAHFSRSFKQSFGLSLRAYRALER
ncbi:helix-turn-helix domain-containing protein [Methylobacillus arboreus]|nr:AraC family transcriptional regulator [Methylobacillus arboreus]MCB5191177.1 helix-turn-helix domain-containing protein [Methylobacillus arboreus]